MFILEGVGFAKHSNVYPRNLSHKTSLTPPHANQVVVVCGSDIKFNIRYHLQQNQDHWSTKEDGVTFLKAARI